MYKSGFRIKKNVGNNSFSYNIRKQNNPEPKIYVTSLIQGTIDDIQIGDKIVFEEIDSKGQIQSFVGLKNFVKLSCAPLEKELVRNEMTRLRIYKNEKIPIYIIDNHNHALFFRYQELFNGNISKGINLIHIDQHTDMNVPPLRKEDRGDSFNNLQDIFHFTNYDCNVGNFIQPAIQDGLISQVIQINTEYSLSHSGFISLQPESNNKKKMATPTTYLSGKHARDDNKFILDIDLDFRHPQMGIEEYKQSIQITKNLISQASLVTIATSPYFLDQTLAIKILKDIFN